MSLDLILLHAPSIYDFRQQTILYGPVSDLVPPSPVFEMYPLGFTSLAEYLERAGYRVRIVNLAVRMLRDRNFSAEQMIAKLEAPVFGIDLHWMVHCHGAIEVARLVKKYHPEARVVLGGFSSSYFYRELIDYPEIDYVIRGDSAEEPLRQLMDAVKRGGEPEAVPNLVWRDSQGKIRENPFSHVPTDLGDIMLDNYGTVIRSVIRHRDLISCLPFRDWLRYPVTAIFTCRGCTQNCVICGGSADTFQHCYNRGQIVFRSPEAIIQNVKQIARFSGAPIFILGDLCQAGEDYAEEVLRLIRQSGVKNQFILELFTPAPSRIIRQMGLACPNFVLEISPESHDQEVRRASGRNYSTEALEQTLGGALEAGCGRLDVFFMLGVPKQTTESVMATVNYSEHLLQRFRGDRRLSLFIAPLSPFIDPGSPGFEHPERHGYRIRFRTLKEHRQALLSPSWKYSLNYETEWMNQHQIAETAYEAILRLNHLKAKYGVIPKELADASEWRIKSAREMMHHLDDLMSQGRLEVQLPALKPVIDEINWLPVSEKTQLELPVGLIKLKPWRYLWAQLMKRR